MYNVLCQPNFNPVLLELLSSKYYILFWKNKTVTHNGIIYYHKRPNRYCKILNIYLDGSRVHVPTRKLPEVQLRHIKAYDMILVKI